MNDVHTNRHTLRRRHTLLCPVQMVGPVNNIRDFSTMERDM